MFDGVLSKTLENKEKEDLKCVLRSFSRLFAKDYIDIHGVETIQQKIYLKPDATPKAQK